MYIDALECKDSLLKISSSKFVTKYMMNSLPFVFGKDYNLYIEWQHDMSNLLSIDPKDIIITGSSSIGFSLNPNNNFSEFNDKSDIDIAIISNYHFNLAWSEIKKINFLTIDSKIKNSVIDHKERLIYYGTIATDKIWSELSFGPYWDKCINDLRKKYDQTSLGNRDWNFRIYTDNDSFRSYQCVAVKKASSKLRNELINGGV